MIVAGESDPEAVLSFDGSCAGAWRCWDCSWC